MPSCPVLEITSSFGLLHLLYLPFDFRFFVGCHLIKKTMQIMVFWTNILGTYEYLVTWQTDTHTIPPTATVEGLSLLDFATSLAPKFFSWPLDKRKICHSLVHYM